MIVVDSSVLIDFLRGIGSPQVDRLKTVIRRERPLLGDLVLCEVLRGARDEADEIEIRRRLAFLTSVEMVGERAASQAAHFHRLLRRDGVTVGVVDLLIATFCIVNRHLLLHSDSDFAPMVQHLGLVEA